MQDFSGKIIIFENIKKKFFYWKHIIFLSINYTSFKNVEVCKSIKQQHILKMRLSEYESTIKPSFKKCFFLKNSENFLKLIKKFYYLS